MVQLQTQLNAIHERIAEAQNIVARRERSVKRAERNLEIAEDNLAQLQNERDELLIASWGDIPNWQVIFDLVNPSPAMYEYKEKWVRKKAFTRAGCIIAILIRAPSLLVLPQHQNTNCIKISAWLNSLCNICGPTTITKKQ
jgi:hypothetical protein